MINDKSALQPFECWAVGDWAPDVMFHTDQYDAKGAALAFAETHLTVAISTKQKRLVQVRDSSGRMSAWEVMAEVSVTFRAQAYS